MTSSKPEPISVQRKKSFVERLAALYQREIVIAGQMGDAMAGLVNELGLPPIKTYVLAASATRLVKIGRALDVGNRLRALQTGSPSKLRVLRVIPFDCERRMHERFAHLRRHGEWFEFDLEMLTETFHEDILGRAEAMLEAA